MKVKQLIVGMLQTNTYILSYEGKTLYTVIIDPGAEPEKILANLPPEQPVKHILLTHNHFDHTDAVKFIKNKLGVKCGIHKLDKIPGITDFVFEDGDMFDEMKVLHTPGHTSGGCCFFISFCLPPLPTGQAGNPPVLFAGDTIFADGGYGRTDLGGSEKEITKSIKEKILTLSSNTIIYPGHGPATTVEQEKEYWL